MSVRLTIVPVINIKNYYKNEAEYYPTVAFSVCYDKMGFHAKFKVFEKSPKAVATKYFEPVHLDNCVEWFVNFAPEICGKYFNFEINANGVLNADFRKDRYNTKPLTIDDAEALNIKSQVFDNFWAVDYTVTFDFIKKFIPAYEFKQGMKLKSNVFKCDQETEVPQVGK